MTPSSPPWLSSNHNDSDEKPAWIVQRRNDLSAIPPEVLCISAFLLGSAATLATASFRTRYLRRFPTSEWVTPDVLAKKRWVKGVVTSVGDADNFRIYHTPGWGWTRPLKFRRVPSLAKELKDQTLHIRMAGVDAPEASHFGKPAQEFAPEALAWLKRQIEGKTVYCRLVQRDQYGRLVSIPMLPPRLLPNFTTPLAGKCLSIEMLRAGWAQTYEQSGAVYGKWGKEAFLRTEAEAKASKRGMWKDGIARESPAEYKRRHAQAAGKSDTAQAVNVEPPTSSPSPEREGWLRSLFAK